MKVMTFNIWNYTRPWKVRRDLIARLIEAHQPDAVALQETRHDWRFEAGKGQGEQLAELTGYHATFALGQVYVPILRIDEGVTILTRTRPSRVMEKPLTLHPHEREDENQRVCLGAAIVSEGREIHVYDTHFSLSACAQETNAEEVCAFIQAESEGHMAFLMGDLNAEPDSPPVRFLTGRQQGGNSAHFIDCWSSANPGDPGCTSESFNPHQRIDYVLVRNLEGRVKLATLVGTESVNGVYPSDHRGIVVEIDS